VYNRTRDEQEARNTAEVMIWIEHLARLPDSTIDLDLVCHINRLTLRRTDRDYWAGRVRAEVDWQRPDEWSRQRAIVVLLLWQSGFPTEILALQRVLDERRDAYVAALRAADQGNIQEWVRFFVDAVVDALQTEMQLI